MCSAMPRRMADTASTVSPSWAVAGPEPAQVRARSGSRWGCRAAPEPEQVPARTAPEQPPAQRAPPEPPGRSASLDEAEDVLLVTRPPRPVPRNLRDVDAVLGRDPGDDRGDEAARRRLRWSQVSSAAPAGAGVSTGAAAAASRSSAPDAAGSGGRLLWRGPRAAPRCTGGSAGAAGAAPRPLGRDHRELRARPSTVSPSWTRICCNDAGRGAREPRCRPCPSRSRAASRRPRPARPRT